MPAILCHGGTTIPTRYQAIYAEAKAEARDVVASPPKIFRGSRISDAQVSLVSIELAEPDRLPAKSSVTQRKFLFGGGLPFFHILFVRFDTPDQPSLASASGLVTSEQGLWP